jgi:hypothetical protein
VAVAAKPFEEVGVWRKAHARVLAVYRLTEQFPKKDSEELSKMLDSYMRSILTRP